MRADDLDTLTAPNVDNLLKEQFGKICLSTQEHAPQKVLACAYTRHDARPASVHPKTIFKR